jgi:hypothetical protein
MWLPDRGNWRDQARVVVFLTLAGQHIIFSGRVGREQSLDSPRDPSIGFWFWRIGVVHLLQSRTEVAIVWLEKARSANGRLPVVYAYLASAYALKGETERAFAEFVEAQRLSDNHYPTIASLKAGRYFGVPKFRALYEATFFVGLRKAGMPEEWTAHLKGATPDVESGIAVGEVDEAAVVDIDVVAAARAAGDRLGMKQPTSRGVSGSATSTILSPGAVDRGYRSFAPQVVTAGSYFSSARPWSHAAMSTLASSTRSLPRWLTAPKF